MEVKIFSYEKEIWDEKRCAKEAKHRRTDSFGSKSPKGIIASCSSSYPEYGQTIRFNGGTVINDEWYEAIHRPLPSIPDTYEIVGLASWGKIIRLKPKPSPNYTGQLK